MLASSAALSALLAACGTTSAPSTSQTTVKVTTTTRAPVVSSYVYPYTGLPAPNAAAVQLPSLEVKIDNSPPAWPQSGLSESDVIYEEMVEGGLTRYFVVFQSHNATTVGPVRSVRASDADLLATLGGLFAYSGGIPAFVADARATGIVDVGANSAAGVDYYRLASRPEPHNLYTSTVTLRASAAGLGSTPPVLFKWRKLGSPFRAAAAVPVSNVQVEFSGATYAQWAWNSALGEWDRTTNGVAQFDASGKAVSAQNVIIEFMPYVNTGFVDPAGNPVPKAESVGSGKAIFLSGGKEAVGTWSKPQANSVPVYRDSNGSQVRLEPGRTFVEMVETGSPVTSK